MPAETSTAGSLRRRLVALDRARFVTAGLVASTVASAAVGLALRVPFLLPILQGLAAYPFFLAAVAAGAPLRAATRVLIFAGVTTVVVSGAVMLAPPDFFARAVPNGVEYRDEMLAFVRSGGVFGEEASPSLFLPKHALHLGLFAACAAASAGLLALVMGAALLDYMSYYVGALGALACDGGDPVRALAFAWSPYAIVRVAGYALLGSGLATLVAGPKPARRAAATAALAGAGLAVVDVILKAALAGWYGQTLLVALPAR